MPWGIEATLVGLSKSYFFSSNNGVFAIVSSLNLVVCCNPCQENIRIALLDPAKGLSWPTFFFYIRSQPDLYEETEEQD